MFGWWRRLANRSLREDLSQLQAKVEELDDDLSALSDRFRRLHGRLAKRGELSDPDGAPAVASPPGQPALTGAAAQLQASILARRGLRVQNGG